MGECSTKQTVGIKGLLYLINELLPVKYTIEKKYKFFLPAEIYLLAVFMQCPVRILESSVTVKQWMRTRISK